MALIDRNGVETLIPMEYGNEIFQGVAEESVIMRLGTRLSNMSVKQRRIPVLSLFPQAYFVNGDIGLKQTTDMAWKGKFLEAEEIATIVPIPEAVLNDSDFDLWAQIRPRLITAIGQRFDRTVVYNESKPVSWPDGIVPSAETAGNVVIKGTGTGYEDIMGEDGLISKVEEDGYMVTNHIGAIKARSFLRGILDTTGRPIFRPMDGMQDGTNYMIDGAPTVFPRNGSIDPVQSLLIAGDFSQIVWATRQDVTFKLLDQAVISDSDGKIIYNLAQQDMVALRVVTRLAWQLPNPINYINETESTRYPFAVLKDSGTRMMNEFLAGNETQNFMDENLIEQMTVEQLKSYAKDNSIDISGLSTKEDIKNKILSSSVN